MGLDKHTITCVYHCSIIQGIFTVGGLSSYSRKMVSRSSKDLERDDQCGKGCPLPAPICTAPKVDSHWLCLHTCPSYGLTTAAQNLTWGDWQPPTVWLRAGSRDVGADSPREGGVV